MIVDYRVSFPLSEYLCFGLVTAVWYQTHSGLCALDSLVTGWKRKWRYCWEITLHWTVKHCMYVILTSQEPFIWFAAHLAGLLPRSQRKYSFTFGANRTFNIYTSWINSRQSLLQHQGRGLSALASWLCRLKPGSHVIPLTWSHGEADVNKTEVSVVQQLAVEMHCGGKKKKKKKKQTVNYSEGDHLKPSGFFLSCVQPVCSSYIVLGEFLDLSNDFGEDRVSK